MNDAPPIHPGIGSEIPEQLWRHVFVRANVRERSHSRRQRAGKPEVGELDVPICGYQGILGLQVTIHHIVPMDMLKREC